MGIDIRYPIGMLFTAIGLILSIFGLVSDRGIYERSLGINVNLDWGLALVVFGVIMLVLGQRGHARARRQPAPDADARRL